MWLSLCDSLSRRMVQGYFSALYRQETYIAHIIYDIIYYVIIR